MKRCRSCSKDYSDEFEFCPECGKPLVAKKKANNRRELIIGLCALLLIVVVATTLHERIQLKNQREAIAASLYEKAIEKYRTTPTTSDIEIESGWKHYVKGNYIYIEGSVKNNSNKEIRYYEIGIKFLDNQGNVIDSDYTNGTDLGPGELQVFDTMHKNNPKYSEIQLYVKEVS